MSLARDMALALKAKRHGSNYSLRIVREARRAGIPVSLGFALIEQESNFNNVFGHDPTIFVGAGPVTKKSYQAYLKKRGRRGEGGMQGVGPAQLTWWEYQDEADRRGGCWKTSHNISTAFHHLAALIKKNGLHDGVKAYNGTGPAAEKYAHSVLLKQRKWHEWLT